jgi:hypothetical protein
MNTFLSILLPLVMIGLIIWFTLRTVRRRKPKAGGNTPAARLGRATWAWARITTSHVQPSDRDWVRVDLEFEVHAPGSSVCTAKATWLVQKESLEYIEVGKEISLKADPQDPSFVFPNAPWAKIPE